jgi:arsenite-transporting ATPase
MGKGGVGKSTLSALIALERSNKRKKSLLISMDPAHNQSDIFEKKFAEKSTVINDNLHVIEIDIDLWIKRYLKKVQNNITDSYRYLSSINLDKKFDVLKYSPGLEEYALLLAFEEIVKKYDKYDCLIFDMPPTALALRFFALPKLSIVWIDSLLELREEILQKREVISKIKFGKREFEADKVLNRLQKMKEQYQSLYERFRDCEKIKINIVMNEDQLSLKESQRIIEGLEKIGIAVSQIFINKSTDKPDIKNKSILFKDVPFVNYPQADYPLIGLDKLKQYLSQAEKSL